MRLLSAVFLCLVITSCAIKPARIAGVYHAGKNSATRLTLHENGNFELSLLNPNSDTTCFKNTQGANCYTTGTWKLHHKRSIVLHSNNKIAVPEIVSDSISRFTNISAFNFWNRYGEPIPIRYIVLPPARPKPHFGNSLYFFSQDFSRTDTIKFFFEGYKTVSYPGVIPSAIGNNIHKVTIMEAYKPDLLDELILHKRSAHKLSSGYLLFQKKK